MNVTSVQAARRYQASTRKPIIKFSLPAGQSSEVQIQIILAGNCMPLVSSWCTQCRSSLERTRVRCGLVDSAMVYKTPAEMTPSPFAKQCIDCHVQITLEAPLSAETSGSHGIEIHYSVLLRAKAYASSPPLPFFFLEPPVDASPVFFWWTMNLV